MKNAEGNLIITVIAIDCLVAFLLAYLGG